MPESGGAGPAGEGGSASGAPASNSGASGGGTVQAGATMAGEPSLAGAGGAVSTGGSAAGDNSPGGAVGSGGAQSGAAGDAAGGAAAGSGGNAGASPDPTGAVPLDPALLTRCTGAGPITCELDAPNGNYDVTVELGAEAAAGATRVQSELFRISLPETTTEPGSFALLSFSVNVRQEQHDGYSASGGILNLLFDGASPTLHGLGIASAPDSPTIFVAGDSTVCDWDPTATNISSENQRGWAQALTQYLKPGIAVANYADSGETAGSFYNKFWGPARELLKVGDYVFVQFGHNDQKNQADIDNYQSNLMRYVDDARAAGATPVLFTPVNRKGTSPNFEGLDQQARDLAESESVQLIDLTNLSIEFYRTQSDLNSLFAEGDGTHLSEFGATAISGVVAEAIKQSDLPLAEFVR